MAAIEPDDEETWRKAAACRAPGVDPDWFFPQNGEASTIPRSTAQAKQVCAGCPVREQCLDSAMTTFEKDGIYGGLTRGERDQLATGRQPSDESWTAAWTRLAGQMAEVA